MNLGGCLVSIVDLGENIVNKISPETLPTVAYGLGLSGFALGFAIGQIIWGG